MGFGGIQGMITSLKNNNKVKGKRLSYFEKNKNSNDKLYKNNSSNFKKATAEQLENIRKKLKKENRKTLYLKLFFIVLSTILLFYLLSF